MENLELYKNLNGRAYKTGLMLIIYEGILSYENSLSDEEIEEVAEIIYDTYIHSEYCDLTILAEKISEDLEHGLTLNEIRMMSRWDILERWGE